MFIYIYITGIKKILTPTFVILNSHFCNTKKNTNSHFCNTDSHLYFYKLVFILFSIKFVDPKLQGKGVTALIFSAMFDTFKRNNIKFLETNPELVDNENVQVLWKPYNPVNHKRRKTFKKDL